MGKSSGSAPQAPDPSKIIPIQSAADRDAFNYQTAANRTNTVGPDSSSIWSKQSNFDQAGYDKAMADWQAGNQQGTYIPEVAPSYGFIGSPGQDNWGMIPGVAGHWEGASSSGKAAPDRNAYTSDSWTQTTQLSPEQQKLHDLGQSSDIGRAGLLDALTARLKSSYANPIDYSGVSDINKSIGGAGNIQTDAGIKGYQDRLAGLDPTQFNQQASDAVYNQQKRYFDESQGTARNAMEARLAEQGFVPGTPGYLQAMNGFQDNEAQALADMRDRSTTQGFNVGHTQFGDSQSSLNSAISAALSGGQFANTAQGQQFSQNKAGAEFGNTSRAQQIAELLQAREQPLNELNAVRNGTQVNTSGQNTGTGSGGSTGANLGTTDIMGAYNNQYKGQLDKYNAGVASDNQDTQSLAALASIAAMFFSDGRLKSDFVNVGETPAGVPVYNYEIGGQRQTGVVAQDLIRDGQTSAVYVDPESGLYAVDYSKVE